MNTQLTVLHAIERSLGNRFEIRFWLIAVVAGRKIESRGTTVTIEQPTIHAARKEARGMASYAQMRIDGNEMDAKAANAALASILAEIPAQDAEWSNFIENVWNAQ